MRGQGGINRLTAGETSVYNITGTDITANSFNLLSEGGGGTPNGLLTAAHVQGINGGLSGHVTPNPVPIPNAALLFGTGLLGLVIVARRKKGFRKN